MGDKFYGKSVLEDIVDDQIAENKEDSGKIDAFLKKFYSDNPPVRGTPIMQPIIDMQKRLKTNICHHCMNTNVDKKVADKKTHINYTFKCPTCSKEWGYSESKPCLKQKQTDSKS
jgi:hypothetical protein